MEKSCQTAPASTKEHSAMWVEGEGNGVGEKGDWRRRGVGREGGLGEGWGVCSENERQQSIF